MNKYQFTSQPLGGEVTVVYREGRIYSFDAPNASFDITACKEKRYSIYFTEAEFLTEIKKHKIQVTVTTIEITFEQFYDRYGLKTGKPEAIKAWKKLSVKDRNDAYYWIPAYESFRKFQQHAQLYPATYLNAKRWIQ